MRDDYLWDKSGDDAEIKRLEDTLAAFSYQETAAPAFAEARIPAKRLFGWRLAFAAACAACLAVAVGGALWLRQSNSVVGPDANLFVKGPATEAQNGPPPVTSAPGPERELIPENAVDAAPLKQKISEPLRVVHRAKRPRSVNSERAAKRTQTVKLTPEEKSAYDQVLLALSITGSKLKMVQDRVNGVDYPATPLNENR